VVAMASISSAVFYLVDNAITNSPLHYLNIRGGDDQHFINGNCPCSQRY
jgi:hypothetical protein